jgi:tetratricopeptide (TPR) repeat protein
MASGLPELAEARLAFEETMSWFGPAAYVKLVSDLRKEWKEPTLEGIAALLRMCYWDQEILIGFRESLKKHLPTASDATKLELLAGLRQCWDNFYPMQYDLPFDLAGYCMMMKEPREALFYLQHSLALYGEHYLTHFRAGLAHGMLGETKEAVVRLEKALALNPNHTSSREMKIRFEARLAG